MLIHTNPFTHLFKLPSINCATGRKWGEKRIEKEKECKKEVRARGLQPRGKDGHSIATKLKKRDELYYTILVRASVSLRFSLPLMLPS